MFEGTDNVSKVIDGLSGKLDDFGGQVQKVTQPLANMAETVLKVEAGLAALAAAGLAVAFNESKKFESASIELIKVLGDESDRLEEAQQNAINLSETYGESANDILQSTADFKQAGFDLTGAMQLTKAAMDLVIAGSLDASQASEILIATLKGFKAPASEAATIVDILNEVSNNYATDVEQLGIGMSKLSPIASLMGFSFQETAGMLTPVIEVFRSGDEAATALKTGLLRIVDDRKPVQDALTAIGVSQTDLNGNLKSGKDILYEVAAAFQKLNPEQQIFFAQNLVGIEQAGKLVQVFANLANVQEVTAVAMAASGSAAKEVAARLESAEVAVNKFIASAQNLAIAVGDQFKSAAKEAIDGGTSIEVALKNMVNAGTFAPILDLVKSFASDLGADLKIIAKNLPEAFEGIDWTGLIASMKNVGGSIVGLFEAAFGDVDLTTVEGLQSAVQKVVDGIAALTNVTAGILAAWKPFVSALASAAEEFSKADGSSQTLTGNILGLGQAVNKVVDNFGIITGALTLLSGAMSVLAGTALFNAIGGFGSLATAVAGTVAALGPFQAIVLALGAGWVLDKVLTATIPKWQEHRDAVVDNIGALQGCDYGLDDISASVEATGEKVGAQKTIWKELTEAIDALPDKATTEIEAKGTELTKSEIEEIQKAFAAVGDKKEITISTVADTESINKVKNIIWEELPDGRIIFTQTDYDQAALSKTSDAINKALPPEKEMEIKLKGDIETQIANIEAQAKVAQSYFEYKAKVDVAEIEAVFKSLENQSNNITQMFENSGDVLVEFASALRDVGPLAALDLMELMKDEAERRDALLIEQQKLTDAQIKYLELRSKAMERGDGIITIQADGLEPELEMVLQKIIQLTQIRANEEGLNFLLGV